jgi:hypothetical protein
MMMTGFRCRAALLAATAFTSVPTWADAVDDTAMDSISDGDITFAAPASAVFTPAFAMPSTTCFDEANADRIQCTNDIHTGAEPVLAHWSLADVQSAAPEEGSLTPAVGTVGPEDVSPQQLGDTNRNNDAERMRIGGVPVGWADHVPGEFATHRGFFKQVGAIPVETALVFAYFSAQSGKKLFRPTTSFHFHTEGWFGKDTTNLGIDKLAHAFNTYILAEFLHGQLHRKTNASEGDAITAAVLASAAMAFNELSDGIEHDSGYSMEDIAMNTAGAVFSVIRNTVPGVKEKLAFKIEVMPNHQVYSYRGQEHYAQQRFMLSLKGAGFKELEKSPFRFLDLQLGYYASDFMAKDRNAGRAPNRHVFVGVGLNLGELLFGKSRSTVGRVAHTVLDYVQLPYTSVRYDLGEGKVFTSPKP